MKLEQAKRNILTMIENTPKDKMPTSQQGIIAYKIASRYFNVETEHKNYAELYNFVYDLIN